MQKEEADGNKAMEDYSLDTQVCDQERYFYENSACCKKPFLLTVFKVLEILRILPSCSPGLFTSNYSPKSSDSKLQNGPYLK